MKIRIMVFFSILIVLVFVLTGCIKIYTTPMEDEAAAAQDSAQNDQQSNQVNEVQQQPIPAEQAQEFIPEADAAPVPAQQPEEPLPDLVPKEIVYDEASLKKGTTIFFDSGILNDGDAPSDGFNIKWFVNGEELGYGGHQGIQAGSVDMTYNSQFYWKPTSSGTYKIEFVVDCDEFIPEEDESNNTVSVTITIP